MKKRRGNLNKFHDRFVMVRGFDILWFAVDDSATSGRFKEKVPLPSIRVDFDVMVGKLKCYTLQKQADLENSRVLTFQQNEPTMEFQTVVASMINLKIYVTDSVRENQKIDPQVCRALVSGMVETDFSPDLLHLKFKETNLDREYSIGTLMDNYMMRKWKIRSLALVDCHLRDTQFIKILKELRATDLESIDVQANKLTIKSMQFLKNYVKNPAENPLL